MSGPDYDTYYAKHCARYYGWLPASTSYISQLSRKRRGSLNYFTLCARQAIDVFMLELEEVLSRDQAGELSNVIICEKIERAAGEIFRLVRPPLRNAILVGELERILLFEDTPETRGLSLDTDTRNKELRIQLNYKRLSERMQAYFPFDIINLDPHGNFLKPDIEGNKRCRSFKRILELQEPADDFLLFLTTPIFDIDPDFEARLRDSITSNAATYPEVHDAMMTTIGTVACDEIDELKRTALGFAKSVVLPMARENGWECEHQGMFVYDRPSGGRILNSVIRFSKVDSAPDNTVYVQDVVRIIRQMPEYYSHAGSLENQEVRAHLERVIEYREQIRNEFRET